MRRFVLGALAYLLPSFPLGYFWHLVTFAESYGRLQMYRSDVIIPMGLTAMLVQALFYSWAYPRLFSTAREDVVSSAVKGFATFSVLAWSFVVLPVAAKYRMTSVIDFVVLESAFTALQYAVVAPLLALAHRAPR